MHPSDPNPCGLRGLAFVELAAPDPAPLQRLLDALGFRHTRRHARLPIDLYEQGEIRVLLDRARDSFGAACSAVHGPCVCAMGWRVDDARQAAAAAEQRGAGPASGDLWRPDQTQVPAVHGIGDALIYLVDARATWLGLGFVPVAHEPVTGKGFTAIDHVTHNVRRGELAHGTTFYKAIFGFTEERTLDVHGAGAGLRSRALRSPCGTFCVELDEATGSGGPIDAFVEAYGGPGIQHVALRTDDLLGTLRALDGSPIELLEVEPGRDADAADGVPGLRAKREELARRHVLVDGDARGYLLQSFTRGVIGPTFLELVQRDHHDAFGEVSSGALLRAIERDQARRRDLA